VSHSTLPATLPGLDLSAGSQRLGGNIALYCRLLGRFPAQYRSTLPSIRSTLAQGDYTTAAQQAHALAGVADNLSAVALARALRELQQTLLSEGAEVTAMLEQAEHAYDQVIQSIGQLGLDKNTSPESGTN